MNPLEWIAGGGRAGGERKTKRKDFRGKSEGVGGEVRERYGGINGLDTDITSRFRKA